MTVTATTAPETLPAAWYHDPEVYARERQAIFRRHWWAIARTDQVTTTEIGRASCRERV